MQRLWLITNPNSGSTTSVKCDAIEAVFAERGLELAGRTLFPDDDLPTADALDSARIDTVALFAGDGTINAALCALGGWSGAFLILPGGTMNMLAKQLHGSVDPVAIVHAAHGASTHVALPYVEAGPHRAFVGIILGPAGSWFRAREAVRAGRLSALRRAVRTAWQRTFGDAVRVTGAPGLRRGYQAIYITPREGGPEVAAIDARDWGSIAALGWNWVTGDWVAAGAVTQRVVDRLRVAGSKPALALFDGEPQTLAPGTAITGGMSARSFISTLPMSPPPG